MVNAQKWTVVNGVNGIVQSELLLATVLFVAYIGFKQTDIATKQTQINEQLLNLEYELSVALEWQPAEQKLILHNQGKHSSWPWPTTVQNIRVCHCTLSRSNMNGNKVENHSYLI
jgi:hypothetical protein